MGEKGLDSKGTGLGLYLCRQIVVPFAGEIWPDAAEGATFRVAVPLASERSTAERPEWGTMTDWPKAVGDHTVTEEWECAVCGADFDCLSQFRETDCA